MNRMREREGRSNKEERKVEDSKQGKRKCAVFSLT